MQQYKHAACTKIRLAVVIPSKKTLFVVKTLSEKVTERFSEVLPIKIMLNKYVKPLAAPSQQFAAT